jgi:hypothetical protein
MDARRKIDAVTEFHRIAFESCEKLIIEGVLRVIRTAIDRIGAKIGPM